jgi:hypothetical protein
MFLQQRFRDVGDQMFHVVYASATSHLLSKAELHAQLEETRRAASEFGIKADIPLLVAHFLGKFTNSLQSVLAISDDALWRLWRLIAYDCPGNVRELENAIECAVALSSDSILTVDDLASIPNGAPAGSLPDVNELVPLAEVERRAILHALRQTEEISSPTHVSSVLGRQPSIGSSKTAPLPSQQTMSHERSTRQ